MQVCMKKIAILDEYRPHSIILASCSLQTWSKFENLVADLHAACHSQAGRNHVESQLRTCLKRSFSTFHLSSTRIQRTCCINLHMSRLMQQAARFATRFSTKKFESVSKVCRKPTRTCRIPSRKRGRKSGFRPGLQLAIE